MAICINCGKENDSCLCASCKDTVDIETICMKIIAYKPGSGENELWERLISRLEVPYHFKNVAFALADGLPSPRREYIQVMSLTGSNGSLPKSSHSWFYGVYDAIKYDPRLSAAESAMLHGIAVEAYWQDYEYEKAETAATALGPVRSAPWQSYCNLAEYYTITRRYDASEDVISDALGLYADDPAAVSAFQRIQSDNERRQGKAKPVKPEYIPSPRENREEIKQKYIAFLQSLGLELDIHKKAPTHIPKGEYPAPMELREPEFDSFVAFDLETTGRSPNYDSIIEYAGVKVVNGEITDTFRELAKPFERKISKEVQELTGIKPEDTENARKMWEVFTDFMRFVGNDVLVGFNCMAFDSKFMVRAGRYANLIVENKYFDVMRYASRFRDRLDVTSPKISLEDLSNKLGVENPQAHSALSDAITTAKVFLELKKLEPDEEEKTVDDVLSDLENW